MSYAVSVSGMAVSHGPAEGGYVIRLDGVDVAYASSQPAGAGFSFQTSGTVTFSYNPSSGSLTISGGAQILSSTISATQQGGGGGSYTQVTKGNKIKATDRSQTGTTTTKGAVIKDSHFSKGDSAKASTFNSRVLS